MRLVLLAVVLMSCSGGPAPEARAPVEETWSGAWSPPPRPGAEVVARVSGAAIYAEDVARQMAATGVSAREALGELIDAELLAAEARRRGLTDDPEVIDARKRERVRAFLKRDFEPTFDGPEDVPQSEVDEIYAMPQVQTMYEHERIHDVAYVRFPVKVDAPPGEDALARAAANAFHDLVVEQRPATKEQFFALARTLPPAPPVEAAPKQVYRTMPSGPAVPEFARAAFSISKVGEVAKPVRTKWGWDVLWLAEVTPEAHTSRDEAHADIRRRRFDASRRMAFQRWVDRIAASYRVERNEALLDEVKVDSLVGIQ
jgi:peptidyl-prolyl cis-trans isomerase C